MTTRQRSIGNRIAPARFLMFAGLALVAVPLAILWHGWSQGVMIGFDVSTAAFVVSLIPLLGNTDVRDMRERARDNDANRAWLLGITALTTLAVMAAVAAELGAQGRPGAPMIVLIVATLSLSWLFGNCVFALHYAHIYYVADEEGRDRAGLDFPATKEPQYWDFVYFAFTLGMTFQTSDTDIQTSQLRRVVTGHSLIAFVFNLGVVAFTINVLGGG